MGSVLIGKMFKKGIELGSAAARLVAKEVRERRNPPVIDRGDDASTAGGPPQAFVASVLQPAELAVLLDGDVAVLLLDCRDDVEWEAGYIDGATQVPMNTLPEHMEDVAVDTDVVVVCLNGVESAEAAEYLVLHKGFTKVRVLDGGMVGWYADMGQERIRVLRAEERTP